MLGLSLVKISGASMDPVLPEGSHILFRRSTRIEAGNVVLVDHAHLGVIVKTIVKIDERGVELSGFSPLSTSRAKMGVIPHQAMRGKMVMAYLPDGRWLSPKGTPDVFTP